MTPPLRPCPTCGVPSYALESGERVTAPRPVEDRLRAMLKQVEWKGEGTYPDSIGCPCCGGDFYDGGNGHGHSPDCELARLLEEST